MENDRERIELMNSLLLSMPGSPIIYYGDEIGMGDNIFLGDRNGVRTPMQWSPDRNAGFSRADPQRLYLPPIMDPIYGYEAVNVEAQARDPSSLLNWMKRMLAVRKTSQAFGRGTLRFLRPGNRKMLAYLRELRRRGDPVRREPVALGAAGRARSRAFKGRVPVELLGRTPFPPIGELPYLLTLPALRVLLVPARDATSGRRLARGACCARRSCRCWCSSTAGRASSATAWLPWRIGVARASCARSSRREVLPRLHRGAALVRRQGRAASSARARRSATNGGRRRGSWMLATVRRAGRAAAGAATSCRSRSRCEDAEERALDAARNRGDRARAPAG